MKLLHEFNYKELSECLYDFYFDIGKLRVFTGYLDHNPVDDQIIANLHEILDSFRQHHTHFDIVFTRINECIVPPEEQEEIPNLVYSGNDLKVC